MPLIIDLKPGEKIIINGAVLENAGANTKIRIHNESNILRQREILSDTEKTTPASRVYLCLQNAYIFPELRERYVELFHNCLRDYVQACPSALPLADEILAEAAAGHYYKALKEARKLLSHESMIMDSIKAASSEAE